jgi:hypothetical protein
MSKELIASLIFLLAGIYGLILSLQLPLGKLKYPGPGMLPLCLSALLCLSGALWIIFGRKMEEGEGKTDWKGSARRLITPLKIVGVTIGFILILERLGYLWTSIIYSFLLLFWVSRYRIWAAIALSLLMGAGSWYFFVKILGVILPRGLSPL